jgi:tetratricopeptide (TPR) repeat protein
MNQWQDAEQHFERALELVRHRKWQQALSELRRATRVNPFNGQWQFHLGLVLDEMGRYDQALRAYRRAVRIEPNNLQIQERVAADLHRVGRLRQALRAFADISQADPSHEPAYCHRLLIHVELGEHDLAEEMFYTARLYKDHCPRCYDYMGRSLAARGMHKRAIYCFQRCLDMEASWPDAWRRLAEVFWNKGETEQARRHYLADLRQNPGRVQTLLDLGDLLLEMGRVDEAGEKYRLCIELAPREADGYLRYGRWLARCRKTEEAQLAFAEALRRNPTMSGVHLELARLAIARGDRAETRLQLRAEHLVCSDDVQVLLGLANLWMDCDGYRTAIACLKRLVTLQPECRDAWLNLAVAQFRRGLYRQGIRSCQQALELEPANRLAMYNLAVAHERMGEYDEALQWARAALKLQPRDVNMQRLEFRLRALRWWGSLGGMVRRRGLKTQD